MRYFETFPDATIAEIMDALDVGYATANVYRSRYRAQQRASEPEWITAQVEDVRIAEDGFQVAFTDPHHHHYRALLPAGECVPVLRRGWRGVLQVWQGAIVEAWRS